MSALTLLTCTAEVPFYTKGTSAANSVSDLFRSRFYNRGEIGSLQSGAADEAAVHVRLGYQLVGVLGVHGAAVLNGNAVGGFLVVQAGDHLADLGADLVGLLSGSGLAGADGPDRLVGDDNSLQLFLGNAAQAILVCIATSSAVTPCSRCSRYSPTHTITVRPASKAALVLFCTVTSVSPK